MSQTSSADIDRLTAALARLLADWWRRQQAEAGQQAGEPVGQTNSHVGAAGPSIGPYGTKPRRLSQGNDAASRSTS